MKQLLAATAVLGISVIGFAAIPAAQAPAISADERICALTKELNALESQQNQLSEAVRQAIKLDKEETSGAQH